MKNGKKPPALPTIDPTDKCNAIRRDGSGYCRMPAGAKTDHLGEGRCWLHGGKNPIKHWLYSVRYRRYAKLKHPRLRELMADMERDPDPLDMIPDLLAVRALAVDYIERYDVWREAFLGWWAAVSGRVAKDPGVQQAAAVLRNSLPSLMLGPIGNDEALQERYDALEEALLTVLGHAQPREVMDVAAAHKIVEAATAIVARIEKVRAENAISRADLFRILREMGATVRRHNDETDPARRLKLIEDDWGRMLV